MLHTECFDFEMVTSETHASLLEVGAYVKRSKHSKACILWQHYRPLRIISASRSILARTSSGAKTAKAGS